MQPVKLFSSDSKSVVTAESKDDLRNLLKRGFSPHEPDEFRVLSAQQLAAAEIDVEAAAEIKAEADAVAEKEAREVAAAVAVDRAKARAEAKAKAKAKEKLADKKKAAKKRGK